MNTDHLTSRQIKIYDYLHRLVGEGPAEFFKDACTLISESSKYSSTTHLVSHLLRDLESAIRDVIETFSPTKQGKSEKRSDIQKLLPLLTKYNFSESEAQLIINKIEQVPLKELRSTQKDEIKQILNFLGISEDEAIAVKWISLAGSSNTQLKLHSRAHREDLKGPRKLDSGFNDFWNDMEEILFEILSRFEVRYTVIISYMDELLANHSPTKRHIDQFKKRVPHNTYCYEYFFRNLPNGEWVEKLFEAGLYNDTPEPFLTADGLLAVRPIWPQSAYLDKLATSYPDQVLRILLNVQTENEFIHNHFCIAALSLPASYAAQFVKREVQWIKNRKEFSELPHHIYERYGKLVQYLAHNQFLAESFELAYCLLEILEESPYPTSNFSLNNSEKKCGPRFRAFDYWRIVEGYTQSIFEIAPARLLKLYIVLLNQILDIKIRQQDWETIESSCFWRPAIEDIEIEFDEHDIKNLLVSIIRKTAEKSIQENFLSINEISSLLEEQNYPVFHRIYLHLLSEFGKDSLSLVETKLLNFDLMAGDECRREYQLLLQKYYVLLPQEQQDRILNYILHDIEKCAISKEHGERRQYQLLSMIHDYLEGDLLRLYLEKLSEFGVYNPKTVSPRRGSITFTSPVSKEILDTMALIDIVDFLQTWQPDKQLFVRDGKMYEEGESALANELFQSVCSNPLNYLENVYLFLKVADDYLDSLLKGLCHAAENGAIEWGNFIDIIGSLLGLTNPNLTGKEQRQALVVTYQLQSLLYKVLNANTINFDLRVKVWELVYKCFEWMIVLESINPSINNHPDAFHKAINSKIGQAYELVIIYAQWCINNIRKGGVPASITDIPEVRTILEEYINTSDKFSIYVHGLLGGHIGTLHYIDHDWFRPHIQLLFMENEYGNAAWNSYIRYGPVLSDSWKDLLGLYKKSLEAIQPVPTSQYAEIESKRFVEHISIMLAFSDLEIYGEDQLISNFFERIDESVRIHFFRFTALEIINKLNESSRYRLEKLKGLWEWRIAKIPDQQRSPEFSKELSSFIFWFSSPVIDKDWSFKILHLILRKVEDFNNELELLNDIKKIAPLYPGQTLETLELLIELPKRQYSVGLWSEKIYQIIDSILENGQDQFKDRIVKYAQRMCANGNYSFIKYCNT